MHLFSTHSWHVVHWDLVITIVFPEFLSTSISRCGTVGFGVLILIFHLVSASTCSVKKQKQNHSRIRHYLFLSLLSQSTQLVPNSTYINSSLWAAMRWLANFPWAPVLFMQAHLESNAPPGSVWQWLWQESRGWTQVRAVHMLTAQSYVFSHGPMLDHKALVAPDPTCSGSLSCKSLLASHCAVFRTNVSSDDCAINTSMSGCYLYVASIYVRLSIVTIHPYLHCGDIWFFVVIYSCHKTPSLKYQDFSMICVYVCVGVSST